jgi:hypothetical protein
MQSHTCPITWLSAEGAGTVDAFADSDVPSHDATISNILGALTFERGAVHEELLGFVHQHGSWIDWRAPPEQG